MGTKRATKATKTATKTKKGAATARKGATTARNGATRARKGATTARNGATERAKGVTQEVALPDPATIKEPTFPKTELVAPKRTGRRLYHPADALKRARRRLLLAWFLRKTLDPALPADFHAQAWTALHALTPEDAHPISKAAKRTALEHLVEELGLIRGVVFDTTGAGDTARDGFRFDVPLKAGSALLEAAPGILAAAKASTETFPALTPALLADAESALAKAKASTDDAQAHDDADAAHRLVTGDEAQLATDVLLDCLDHLSAAARSTLSKKRPKAASFFLGALEPHAHAHVSTGGAQPTTPAATPPATEPAK